MKKVLLLSLGLVMGLSAFAQVSAVRPLAKPMKVAEMKATGNNFAVSSNLELKGTQSVVANRGEVYYEAEGMYTSYDLQSNAYVANRMYQLKDGSVAVTATMSNEEYDENFPDRGTGYNFAKGGRTGNFSDAPESRIEANATGADIRTGWPSIAPYGAEGEILVVHYTDDGALTKGLYYYTREKAGQGEWNGPNAIPVPADLDEVVGGENNYMSWARIVTTGENNDVVHVFANAAGDENSASYYLRTEDLENWDIQYSPLEMDDLHINVYNADGYAVSANGDNIAVLYCDRYFYNDVMLYESNDAGKTWESRMVWESPVDTAEWFNHPDRNVTIMSDFYAPTQGSVAIGKDGVSHVALSVGMYDLKGEGYYSLYYGLMTDGIAYWNDTTTYPNIVDNEVVYQLSPIRSPQDDSLKHALRLWWIDQEDPTMMYLDFTNFCAVTPPHPEEGWNGFKPANQYTGSADGVAGDYLIRFGVSAFPSIAVDPAGNLAIAFSAPEVTRLWQTTFYYRSCYVNYKPVDSLYWGQMPVLAPTNFYSDFIHTADECTFVSAVSTPVRENEFWFSCLSDDTPGFHTGATGASQPEISYGTIHVFKFNPEGTLSDDTEAGVNEAIDVVYNIYPNPASEYIVVASSMDADATVTFTNIAGQTVKVVNTNLTTGDNSIVINDLTSGVYFCTVTANGYSHTSKVVVK